MAKKPRFVPAELACQPKPEFRVHDVSRVDEVDGRGEVVGILQKERPEFGKIHRVALVHGELGLIGFHVTEIGIDGSIEHQAVFEDELAFAAAGAFQGS